MTQEPSKKTKDRRILKASYIDISARIAPQSESSVFGAIRIPPDTEPGQYSANVICGSQKIPIEINVLEYRETNIEPSHIRLKVFCGEKISYPISITNLGNLPFELGDVGVVWLRETDWIGRTLVYALRETVEEDTYQDFGNRLLQNFREEIIPPIRINFEPTGIKFVSAGDSVIRNMSLIMPQALRKGRRYLGFIKINENRIWLEIYCTGSRLEKDTRLS